MNQELLQRISYLMYFDCQLKRIDITQLKSKLPEPEQKELEQIFVMVRQLHPQELTQALTSRLDNCKITEQTLLSYYKLRHTEKQLKIQIQ